MRQREPLVPLAAPLVPTDVHKRLNALFKWLGQWPAHEVHVGLLGLVDIGTLRWRWQACGLINKPAAKQIKSIEGETQYEYMCAC